LAMPGSSRTPAQKRTAASARKKLTKAKQEAKLALLLPWQEEHDNHLIFHTVRLGTGIWEKKKHKVACGQRSFPEMRDRWNKLSRLGKISLAKQCAKSCSAEWPWEKEEDEESEESILRSILKLEQDEGWSIHSRDGDKSWSVKENLELINGLLEHDFNFDSFKVGERTRSATVIQHRGLVKSYLYYLQSQKRHREGEGDRALFRSETAEFSSYLSEKLGEENSRPIKLAFATALAMHAPARRSGELREGDDGGVARDG